MAATVDTRSAIRTFLPSDLRDVVQIERACFQFAWDRKDFRDFFSRPHTFGLVLEADGEIVGYLCFHVTSKSVYMTNMGVHPDHQRCGHGRQLLERIKDRAVREGVPAYTVVRESNLPAQLFLKANGFYATQILRDFYKPVAESAIEMTWLPDGVSDD
jgi:ribosomal-protein-alanine N-acetyltransferase